MNCSIHRFHWNNKFSAVGSNALFGLQNIWKLSFLDLNITLEAHTAYRFKSFEKSFSMLDVEAV